MTPWLAVVGMGEDGPAGLGAAARALVDGAELLVGDERLLALVPEDGRPRLAWPRPLTALFPELARRRGRRVCVLASGDPLHYGVGVRLLREFPIGEVTIIPAPSAFSLACARLGWPRAEVETLSLHNHPVEALAGVLQPGARLLVLTADGRTPALVAALLRQRGYGPSRLTVLERMGGPQERVLTGTAADWPVERTDDLNTLAVDCIAGPEAVVLPRTAGLPDDAFLHDGQLTKREARAATLAALAPVPGQLLWDVGAGCGSVSVEWVRAGPRLRALAVERDPCRRGMIAENVATLAGGGVRIVAGEAPQVLDGLDPPDAVFIGGGLTVPGLVEACWQGLARGGRLVANTVTVEGERVLFDCHARWGGDLTRIAVSRAAPVGSFAGWRALMPVTQYAVRKP